MGFNMLLIKIKVNELSFMQENPYNMKSLKEDTRKVLLLKISIDQMIHLLPLILENQQSIFMKYQKIKYKYGPQKEALILKKQQVLKLGVKKYFHIQLDQEQQMVDTVMLLLKIQMDKKMFLKQMELEDLEELMDQDFIFNKKESQILQGNILIQIRKQF